MTGIYFSGTSNTKYCLSRFLSNIGTEHSMYAMEDSDAVPALTDAGEIVFAYPVYYSNLPKIDHAKCSGCGVCEKACPLHNIHVENGKAVSGSRCTRCYRCFSNCPQKSDHADWERSN